MTAYPVDWIDAFADRPFAGNPCAVVHDADGVPPETRIAFVRETGLVECAYVVASDRADFGARYYLANAEIPMAGHPTVATVVSLVERGLVAVGEDGAEITLEVGAGVLPIRVERRAGLAHVAMTQAAPAFGPEHDPAEIAAIYGLEAEDVAAPPQTVSTGTPFAVTLLRDRGALMRARLDPEALRRFRETAGHPLAGIMEPYLATLDAPEGADSMARLLLAPPMPPEDPFTGSATGCLGAYLWARGLIAEPRFRAAQGDGMGRPGRAEVEVIGAPGAIEGVRVAGTGIRVMRGWAELPATG